LGILSPERLRRGICATSPLRGCNCIRRFPQLLRILPAQTAFAPLYTRFLTALGLFSFAGFPALLATALSLKILILFPCDYYCISLCFSQVLFGGLIVRIGVIFCAVAIL
jgi:membrane glycosyltransferase